MAMRQWRGATHWQISDNVFIIAQLFYCRGGEMVDTLALGASARKGVEVQVLSSAKK